MFFDSFKSSLLAQTISCSVFNEINKKKSTLNGVFIMTHSFHWILQIPSSPLWVLHSGVLWVSASLPGHATPKLGGPLLSCLSMCVVPSVQEWEQFWGSRWVPMCVYESLHWNREGGRPSFPPADKWCLQSSFHRHPRQSNTSVLYGRLALLTAGELVSSMKNWSKALFFQCMELTPLGLF